MDREPRPLLDLTARCACGNVELHLHGTVRAMLMCACEDCQKATGTGHSTGALVRRDDVTITGETRSFARPADSGATFTRCFCGTCGTPLYGHSSRGGEVVMLPVGLFGKGAEWFVPTQLIFARSHHAWDSIDTALPRHETYRPRSSA